MKNLVNYKNINKKTRNILGWVFFIPVFFIVFSFMENAGYRLLDFVSVLVYNDYSKTGVFVGDNGSNMIALWLSLYFLTNKKLGFFILVGIRIFFLLILASLSFFIGSAGIINAVSIFLVGTIYFIPGFAVVYFFLKNRGKI